MRPPCFLASGPINGRGNCSIAGAIQLGLRGLIVGYGYLVVIWVVGVTCIKVKENRKKKYYLFVNIHHSTRLFIINVD